MVLIGIGSALLGLVLGLRLKVLVLLPTTVFGLVIFALVAAVGGTSAYVAALGAVLYVVVLQLGYLGGLFTRFVLAATRIRTHNSARSSAVRN
jgi:hypothetical protein